MSKLCSTPLRFGSKAGKQRTENVGAVNVVRLLLMYGGSVRLRDMLLIAVGGVLCTAVLMGYFGVAALTRRTR